MTYRLNSSPEVKVKTHKLEEVALIMGHLLATQLKVEIDILAMANASSGYCQDELPFGGGNV